MAILLVAAGGGAPGATTLAVGLALTWPRPVLLVDCDPGAHQAVQAGYLAGLDVGGRGLVRVAEAHRDRRPLREVVLDQCLPLTQDEGPRRLFLPGFSRPGSATLFSGTWEELADVLDRLDDVGMDVVVDVGRLGPPGVPPALLERSARAAIVLRSNLRGVVSTRVHLPALLDHDVTSASRAGLVLVGERQPYGRTEIARALGVGVLGVVADDPAAAAHLSDGRPRPRRFDSSPLVRSVRALAGTLQTGLRRSYELVEP